MKKKENLLAILLILITLLNFLPIFLSPNETFNEKQTVNSINLSTENQYAIPIQRWLIGSWARGGIDISSDGQLIVAGTLASQVYLFNRSQTTPIWLNQTGSWTDDVAISSNGQYIAASLHEGTFKNLYLFNNYSAMPLWNFSSTANFQELALSSKGEYIVAGTGGLDDKLYFLDNTGTLLWSKQRGSDVTSVAISSNGNYIVAGSGDGNVTFYDKDGNQLWSYISGYISSVSMSDDGSYIVVGSNDNKVYLYDNVGTSLWNFTANNGVKCVKISTDGNYIGAGCYNQYFYLLNRSNLKELWNYSIGGGVNSVDISADGRYITAGGQSDYIYLFTRSNSIPLWTYKLNSDVYSVAISSDGKYIVAGGDDNYVYLFSGFAPNSFSSYLDTTSPDPDGIFNIHWSESIGADNYSIYYSNKTIIGIDNDAIKYEEGIDKDARDYPIYIPLSGDYYFVVVSYNRTGYSLTNNNPITISIPPGSFTLESNAEDPDTDGSFLLTWTTSKGADNYSVYIHDESFSSLSEDILLLDEGITKRSFPMFGLNSGDCYFVIVAYNETGQTLSNILKVKVRQPIDESEIDLLKTLVEIDLLKTLVIISLIIGIIAIAIASFEFFLLVRRRPKERSVKELINSEKKI